MTKTVYLMIGIPGSGKSTWVNKAMELLDRMKMTNCAISRDAVRKSILKSGDKYFDKENQVFEEFIRQINEALSLGIEHVFIDATHLNFKSRRKILNRLLPDPSTNLIYVVIKTDLKTAIERNNNRTEFEKVPEETIRNMYKCFTEPEDLEFDERLYGFNNIEIIDIKG